MRTTIITLVVLVALALAAASHLLSGSPPTQAVQIAASNPFAEHAVPVAERSTLRGTVRARLDAGPYAYLRLRQADGGEAWLVSLAATTPKQQRVRAIVLGRAEHFHSRRLERDFNPLLFAAVRGDDP
jgi:hypothetical protein